MSRRFKVLGAVRRAGKILGLTLAAGVVLVLLVLAALQFSAVREGLAQRALPRVVKALPGTLQVGSLAWPTLGHLELAFLFWGSDGDTLVAADSLTLVLDLEALRHRDLLVRRVAVRGARIDLPAIRAAFPPAGEGREGAAEESDEPAAVGLPWLQAGPLGPSFAVAALSLEATRVRLDAGRAIEDLAIEGSLEARQGRPLHARLAALLGLEWPVRIEGQLAPSDSLRVTIYRAGEEPPPGGSGVLVRGQLLREEGVIQGVRAIARIEVPPLRELERIPLLREPLRGLPSLEGLGATVAGSLRTAGGLRGDLRVDLHPGTWVRGGSVHLTLLEDLLIADSLALELEGLRLQGRWAVRDGRHDGDLRGAVRGTGWARPFADPAALPESLVLDIAARVKGPPDALRLDVQVDGAGRVGEFVVDDLALAAGGILGPDEPLIFAVEVAAGELFVQGLGELTHGERLQILCAPWRVTLPGPGSTAHVDGAPAALPARPQGSVVYDAARESLGVRNLSIEGAPGDVLLRGTLVRGRGALHAALRWPRPPEALRRFLAPDSADWAALQAGWRPPYEVLTDVRLTPGRIAADASLLVPGPAVFGPLLLPEADLAGLAAITGEAHLALNTASGDWTARADFSPTPWIEELRVEGGSDGPQTLRVDSLSAALLGLRATGRGALGGESVAGNLTVDIEDAGLLRRLIPAWDDSTRLDLHVEAEVGGRQDAPTLAAEFHGAFGRPDLKIPWVEGFVRRDSVAGVRGAVLLPRGAQAGGLRLDSAAVEVEPDELGRAARVRLRLASEGADLSAAAVIDTAGGLSILADSLRLHLAGQELTLRSLLTIQLPDETRGLMIDGLDLGGEMGTLRGRARATPGDSVFLDLEAEGITLGPDEDVRLRLRAHHRDSCIVADLTAEHEERRLLVAHATYPVDLQLTPLALTVSPGAAARFQVALDDFPLPAMVGEAQGILGYLSRGGQTRAPRLSARGQGFGPLDSLQFHLSGTVDLRDYSALEAYRARFDARGLRAGGLTAWSASSARGWAPAAELFDGDSLQARLAGLPEVQRGIALQFGVASGARTLLAGDAQVRLPSGEFGRVDSLDGSLALRVRSEGIDLSDLTAFLPQVQRLGGRVAFDVSAQGPLENFKLDGDLSLSNAQVLLREGTRATAAGRLRLGGSLQAPSVTGRITVENGRIQIPETPRNLHPREGQALLWPKEAIDDALPRAETLDQAAADSLAPRAADAPVPGAAAPGTPASGAAAPGAAAPGGNMTLNAQIVIPAGVWLTGHGLEVELTGDLRVSQSAQGAPSLVGVLQARRGTMEFQGRKLAVERGTVTFYGTPELNPSLDIALVKEQGDIKATVAVTGTLQAPRLTLSSEPEMPQADILAFLIFGQRSAGLDQAQSRALEEQALATAEQFAASRLAEQIGRELGFDVLSYEGSAGDSLGRSVTIGKYLSPNLLVKYEQDLARGLGLGVIIEYYLGSGFQLQMHTRRNDQDGVTVGWERDFE